MKDFLERVDPTTREAFIETMKDGEQFAVSALTPECYIPVFILSAYADKMGLNLVDDQAELIGLIHDCDPEPENYGLLALIIVVLYLDQKQPTLGLFISFGIDKIFDLLWGPK